MSDTAPTSTNIKWHGGEISAADRAANMGQRGGSVWFTGLSGSGKSTVAVAVEKRLLDAGRHVYRLDGDNIRFGLGSNLGFSPADRTENIRRIGEVTKLFADSGMVCLNSFISPYRADRDAVRALHDAAGLAFVEVHVDCTVDEAARRDPKGLYAKAKAGEIKNFTGISAPYEAPAEPELRVDTTALSVEEAAEAVVAALEARGVVPGG